MSTSKLAAMILTAGVDDWIPMVAIEGFARQQHVPSDEVMHVILSTIEGLARSNLIEIGDVSDEGFSRWQGTIDAHLERIRHFWEQDDPDVRQFGVWLSNTPDGDAAADRSRCLKR